MKSRRRRNSSSERSASRSEGRNISEQGGETASPLSPVLASRERVPLCLPFPLAPSRGTRAAPSGQGPWPPPLPAPPLLHGPADAATPSSPWVSPGGELLQGLGCCLADL